MQALLSIGGLIDTNHAESVRRSTRRVIQPSSVDATTELERPKTRVGRSKPVAFGDDLTNVNHLALGMKAAHSIARIQVETPMGARLARAPD